VLLVWGDADRLYPASEAAYLEAGLPGTVHRAVPGGQHLHLEERPWEAADALLAWLRDQGVQVPPATSVS
jgi:pimeloyl-ACP methyl ester carboxylesterase